MDETRKVSEFVEVDSIKIDNNSEKTSSGSYFDGSLLELLAFSYFYYFITVITAGLLSAWGKCLLNKYIYNHTVVSGKRLCFEGNGEDLFPKMFKWDFFKLITFNIYSIWVPTYYKRWEVSNLRFEDEKLIPGESYFTGTVIGYFGINILYWLLTGVSFGLLQPVAYVIRLKWELNHTIINRKVVVFRGSAGVFFLKRLLWSLLTMITFGIYGLWIPINTYKWQFSNTFLLRNGEKDGNIPTPEEINATSSAVSNNIVAKKPKSKVGLFIVLGAALIVFIIVLVNIISLFRPYDPEIENEIRTVATDANNYIKQYGVDYSEEAMNKIIPYKDIKKFDIEPLTAFRKNGGKGWVEYYRKYTDYDNITYININMVLRKKSTVCVVKLGINDYYPEVECKSFKDFWAERLNLSSGESKSSSSMYVNEYAY